MNTSPMRHRIGALVTVTEIIETPGETPPPQPWEGRVIKTTSKYVKCRPATVYHVETSSGAVLRAYYRHVKEVKK